MELSPDKYSISELVKYQGKDCIILDIIKNSLGYNDYQLCDVESGRIYLTTKPQLSKNKLESIDFSLFDNDLQEGNFDLGISDALLLESTESTPSTSNRHSSLSVQDLDMIADANNEVSTNHSTKWAVKLFKDWLAARAYSPEFEMLPVEDLASKLRQFYGEANPKKGETYSRSSLIGIRAGINRHIQSPPYNRTISIVLDREFIPANKVLTGRVKQNRTKELDITKHKSAIPSGDIEKMYKSRVLSNDSPVSLQNKVFFELCLHFGRRGREGLHSLRKNSFQFICDDSDANVEYVTLNFNEKSKKNQGTDPKRKENDQRMYSKPDDANCPVKSLKMYLNKLNPQLDSLFQKPRSNINVLTEETWYCNKAIGVNTLSNKMKCISKEANLSQVYTNHSIRATTSTVLVHSDFNENDIISVTGHKDPKSLISYVASTSNEQRKQMSSVLHNYGKGKENSSVHLYSSNVDSIRPGCSKTLISENDKLPLTQNMNSLSQTSNVTYNIECRDKQSFASELATKIFEGNTISGGNFNINFNFK